MALDPIGDHEYDYKYAEESLKCNYVDQDIEEESFKAVNDALNDIDDPSISDTESNKTPKHSAIMRKKSKSSTNILIPSTINQNRPRRHSESSSESHSNEYRKKHRKHTKKHHHHHQSSNSSTTNHKLPILVPLNANGKSSKTTIANKKKLGLKKSILSKYKKSVKHKNKTEKGRSSLGISSPVNVQHVIHVEWDQACKAYKGIPDVWHSKIPQSVTVSTQQLPVQFERDNRSISVTQSMLHRAKSVSSVHHVPSISHHPLTQNVSNTNTAAAARVPIDYISINDSLAMPMPGPRVFISSLNKKTQSMDNISASLQIPAADFHGLSGSQVLSVKEYLSRIGINDLNKKESVAMIRREFFLKMGFSKRDRLVNIPRNNQQQILTYLDIKSYLRCCVTCSDLASFLDDPIIWKVQVEYKSKVQGTLHKTDFRLRHRVWKATYLSMVKIDLNPRYYDHVWNIVVAGDTKQGQNRLVVSLGRHWRCKLTGLEPVISAVNGTYRFGVDFVIRRVIIRDIIIKLQVWDGGNVMADTALLQSVNIFLILFDLTNKNSFDRTLNVARSMISLLPNISEDDVKLMMVGNTTNDATKRVVSYESAKRFANERGLMYIEANTDSPTSINKAFVNLAEECMAFESKKSALQSAVANKQNNNCLIQ